MPPSAPTPSHPPQHTNRLAKETSPYLLQHQHNPVDWYAWGPDAFAAARRENKPIFVSVGYSTCYWCHVMERQSFENEAVAAEMNKRFINIKVDREERPDVDQLYMTAVQVLTQHGGWPMSVFLAPDLRPFYGGTYYPPERFVAVLRGIDDAFHNRPADVVQHCTQLTDVLEQLAEPARPQGPIQINHEWVEHLVSRSALDYEPHHGGFGGAPKFPRETLLEMLLVHNRHFPSSDRMKMVRHALVAMAEGGIRDQLGGGFHRYSTDAQWLVPHFEIMLYDNAMLGWVYAEAFRQTQDVQFAKIARGIFDFVLREMTSPEGAFYTAFDAEVDAQEGLSYLWTAEEVSETLRGPMVAMPTPNARAVDKLQHEFPHADVQLFLSTYGLDLGPNFADPHHGGNAPDKNILFLPRPLSAVAADAGLTVEQLDERLEPMRQRLYEARRQRKQPLLDTKIITSWNAVMIRALAFGGKVLQEDLYIDAAARAATFLHDRHRTPSGGLWRTSRDGITKHDAFLDDYAFLIRALVALVDAGGETKWSDYAQALAVTMIQKFGDTEETGQPTQPPAGFYFTSENATDLIVRQKVGTDSPLPSGNAMAAIGLLELGNAAAAQSTLALFAPAMSAHAEGMGAMVEAAALYLQANEPFTVSAAFESELAARPKSPNDVATDVVSLQAVWASDTDLHVHATILDTFHIYGRNPGDGLIATRLEVQDPHREHVISVDYPPGEGRSFAFAQAPIRIYDGTVTFSVRFGQSMTGPGEIRLSLSYQACNEDACFAPVTKQLTVELPNVGPVA